jgi:signal recognition particle receptor subunit beta
VATLDLQRDAVVVRIVYDGPPTSGKTTSLRSLAERFGGTPPYTPEEANGRTLFFDWMEYTGGRFEGRQIHCQIVSAPGQRALAPRRQLLLASADAVVFVADTSRSGMPQSRKHLENLTQRLQKLPGLPVGIVLQANKRDLPDAEPLEALRNSLGLAVIESIASAGEGIREAFVLAVRLALDRVREQIRLGELTSAQPGRDVAQELLQQMRGLPLEPGAEQLWAPTASAAMQSSNETPRVPDATIPGGWIWPPINGRILLQEASRGSLGPAHEVQPGEWSAESSSGWRFHSSPTSVFSDAETARTALIRWAQLHALAAGFVSPHRCIALCDAGDGTLRLWQVVRQEKSLRSDLSDTTDRSRWAEANAACERVAQRWSQAPIELPCSLEDISASDEGAFIGLMPGPDQARPSELGERRSSLRQR